MHAAKKLLATVICCLPLSIFAQSPQHAINEQVWIPFCEALKDLDTAQYLLVHSKSLIRAEHSNQKIYGYATYAENTKAGFAQARVNATQNPDIKFDVELRFLDRLAGGELAFETGYYKSTLTFPNGKQNTYYSQFYVSLRKENNRWKILTDSSLPLPHLTEQEFNRAKPIEG